MTQTASNGEARSTRYHVSHPPRLLHGILSALAKETRSAEYRRHGGHPDPNWIRAIVKGVAGGNQREADADEIRRFLLNEGVLVESDATKGWVFDPAKADDLYRRCGEKDASLVRGLKTFVEMCERTSDPAPSPELDLATADTLVQRAPEVVRPRLALLDFDDELLELHREELAKTIEEKQNELAATEQEQRRRVEKKRLEHEIEELELELAAKRKALAAHNTY